MISTGFPRDNVIDVHLTLICATQLADASVTIEHALSLIAVTPAV
jgi:hypothetical protein